LIEDGWTCSGDVSGRDTCHSCGNGVLEASEECDDANTKSDDGCSSSCTVELGFTCIQSMLGVTQCNICGNGIPEAPETCDDLNTGDMDGCNSNCQLDTGYFCAFSHGAANLTSFNFRKGNVVMFSGLTGSPQILLCPRNHSIDIQILEFDLTNADGKWFICEDS
jgi:cysteine-rich repeat protein